MGCTTGQNSTCTPCIMGCTTACVPMHHGLYNRLCTSCNMACTTSCLCVSWAVQPIPVPWLMDCTILLIDTYISGLYTKQFLPCNLRKLNLSYPCPPIPPICFSYSISFVPWFVIPHPLCPCLPYTFHIPEGPNYPFHLFHNNILFLTPPLCSCPGSQPVNSVNCVVWVLG